MLTTATLPAFAANTITTVTINSINGVSGTSVVYNGTPQIPDITDLTIEDDGSNAITSGVNIIVVPSAGSNGTDVGTVTIRVTGDGLSAYSGSVDKTYTITPAPLFIRPGSGNGIGAVPDKVYNAANTIAVASGAPPVTLPVLFDGLKPGDEGDVTFNTFTGNVTFVGPPNDGGLAKSVGTYDDVTITWTVSGPKAGNYTPQLYHTTGAISKRPVNVVLPTVLTPDAEFATAPKVYDGTNTINLTAGFGASNAAVLTGAATTTGKVITADASGLRLVATGTLSDRNVGTSDVYLNTVEIIDFSTGLPARNYEINSVMPARDTKVATATINKKTVYVGGISVADKKFDGTNVAALPTGEPFISSVDGSLVLSDREPTLDLNPDVHFINPSPITGATFGNTVVGGPYSINLTAGSYALTGSGSGNYDLQQPAALTANITVASGLTFDVASIPDKIYSGAAQTHALVVKAPTIDPANPLTGALSSSTDYDVAYSSNNTNVGEVTVTLTGKGNYLGSSGQATFNIVPKDVNVAPKVRWTGAVTGQVYTGDTVRVRPTSVAINPAGNFPTPMVEGRDYVLWYTDALDVTSGPQAKARIAGIGNFCGEFETNFAIGKATATPANITVPYIVAGGEHLSIDLDALLPTVTAPAAYGTVRYGAAFAEGGGGGDILNGAAGAATPSFSDSTVTSPMLVDITPIASIVDGTSASTITVKASSDNYNDVTIIFEFSVAVSGQLPVNISGVTMDGGVYNGSPYVPTFTDGDGTSPTFKANDGTPVSVPGFDTVYYKIGTVPALPRAPKDAGNYKVLVTPTGTGYVGSREYLYTIAKRPLKITIKDTTLNQNETLPVITQTYVTLNGDDFDAATRTYEGFVTWDDTVALNLRGVAQFAGTTSNWGTSAITFVSAPNLQTTGTYAPIAANYLLPTLVNGNVINGTLKVNKYEVPGAPTDVVADPYDGQAIVSFVVPTDDGIGDHNGVTTAVDDITSYRVTTDDGFTAFGTESPITITGLTNDRLYTFTVAAKNAVGWSPESVISAGVTPIAGATPPPAGPTAPSQISAVIATAGVEEATVAFAAPNPGSSAITSYTVTSSGGQTATEAASPITVTGLTAGTSYTFTVTATSADGTSVPSAPSNAVTPTAPVTPPTPPATPTVTIGSVTPGVENATVEFTTDNAGKTPTNYTVISTPGNKATPGAGSPITVDGLSADISYTFKVMVDFSDAPSIVSAASTPAVTPLAPPAVVPNPQKPTITDVTAGNGEATITFDVDNDGAEVTDYTVVSTPEGHTQTSAGSPIKVTGLTNGIAYTFTVTVNFADATPSLTSDASVSVTPEDPTVPVDPGTGINNVEEVATVKLYPNPAIESVTITGLQGNETIRFYDANGRTVLTRKATNSTEVIPVSQLQKGIYIVRIGTKALKLVKI
ncbi:hypothetical protein AGMMS49965_06970 [Bacteroidia bacterium]|nr:hypothetical protein AGMMS49965_06970 [Bacteroidia bacterium]